MGFERTLLLRTVANKRRMFCILGGRILTDCIELCYDVNRVSVAVDTVALCISPSHPQVDFSALPAAIKLLLRWIFKKAEVNYITI
jgi:hypothetical protein